MSTTTEGTTLSAQLAAIFAARHPRLVANQLAKMPPAEIAMTLSRLPATSAATVLMRMDPNTAGPVLSALGALGSGSVLEALDDARLASLVVALSADDRKAIVGLLTPGKAAEIEEICAYPAESAGWLMDPKFILCRPDHTVGEALTRVRANPEMEILDLCVANDDHLLVGLVPIRYLATAAEHVELNELITAEPIHVHSLTPRDEVVDLLEKSKATTVPVCELDGRIVGVIRHDELLDAVRMDAISNMQAMVGVSKDERVLSSPFFAVRKRQGWLQINLLTAFLAAAVVGLFVDTIAQVAALAVLLPVVAGQSGNAGAQALAVTLRGLALREVRPRHWGQMARKELMVGMLNGLAVAATTALGVFVWSRSLPLAGVIACSMVVSMMAAGIAGASIPVALTKFGQDPAQSSSIFLTTITDVVGFTSFLGLATLCIAYLPVTPVA